MECDLINATRATLRSGKSSLVTFSDRMVLYYCQNSGLAMEVVCSRSRSLLCYNFRTRLHVHFLLVSQARPFPFRGADRFHTESDWRDYCDLLRDRVRVRVRVRVKVRVSMHTESDRRC